MGTISFCTSKNNGKLRFLKAKVHEKVHQPGQKRAGYRRYTLPIGSVPCTLDAHAYRYEREFEEWR